MDAAEARAAMAERLRNCTERQLVASVYRTQRRADTDFAWLERDPEEPFAVLGHLEPTNHGGYAGPFGVDVHQGSPVGAERIEVFVDAAEDHDLTVATFLSPPGYTDRAEAVGRERFGNYDGSLAGYGLFDAEDAAEGMFFARRDRPVGLEVVGDGEYALDGEFRASLD